MRNNRSMPDKSQAKLQAQVPFESLTKLGSPLGPALLSDANQVGPFNVGSTITQAQSGSIEGKKALARSRAHITLVSVANEPRSFPKSTPIATVSKLSNGTCDQSKSSFSFTATARNKLEVGHCRNSDHGEKCLEAPLPTRDGGPTSDGSTLGKDPIAGDTEINGVVGDSSRSIKSGVLRSEIGNDGG